MVDVREEAGRNGKKPGPPLHDDLCAVVDEKVRTRHGFTAEAANQLWIGDITEYWTGEGKLYLCAFTDVFSNRIVGYSIDSRMKSRLAATASPTPPPAVVVLPAVWFTPTESRRSRKFFAAARRHHPERIDGPSRLRPDNASMESFFSLLQKQCPEPGRLGDSGGAPDRDP